MKHSDLFEDEARMAMYDPEEDETVRELSDTRKPRLQLKFLNKLRKMREMKKAEKQKDTRTLEIQYVDNAGE